MHGCRPACPPCLNAEVSSMRAFVDSGLGLENETSPGRVALEKAQTELRQEYDAREERRRELGFLESGGNPLDFKFANAGSLSVQSTSLTEQLADEYVLSEAKDSFPLATSPHGDSAESSGRPTASVGRDSNTADNLLLFDDNSNPDGEKIIKRTGKRSASAAGALEQSSKTDSSSKAKESDDSVVLRLGVKNQAYARRYRSRSSHDSARIGSTDLFQGLSNKSTLVTPTHPNCKESLWEPRDQEHTASSLSNSKAASSIQNIASKVSPEDRLDSDAVCDDHMANGMINENQQGTTEAKVCNRLQENNHHVQQPHVVAVEIPDGGTSTCNSDGKRGAASDGAASASSEFVQTVDVLSISDKAKSNDISCNGVAEMQDDNLDVKDGSANNPPEDVHEIDVKAETSPTYDSVKIAGREDGERCLLPKEVDGSPNEGTEGDIMAENSHSKLEKSVSGECMLPVADKHTNEKGKSVACGHDNGNEHTALDSNMEEPAVQINEMELCKDRSDPQNEVRSLDNVKNITIDTIIRTNNFLDDTPKPNKVSVLKTVVPANHVPPYPSLLRKGSSELQSPSAIHSKLVKRAREDAILKEARMIEANRKRAGLLSSSNSALDRRQKCNWDFVLEEMAWMANDFMQERLWKIHAAAHVCHWIASSDCALLRKENVCQRQKSIAREISKAVQQFWNLARVSCGSTSSPSRVNDGSNLTLNKPIKVDGIKAENDMVGTGSKLRGDVGSVQDYACRFLSYNISQDTALMDVPATPDRLHDPGIVKMSWEDQLSEESLFYTVPIGAMQAYRESVEAQFGLHKKRINDLKQEDVDTSSMADGPHEYAFEEDEGETGTFVSPGTVDGSSKFNLKKRKIMQQKTYGSRLYDVGTDLPCEPCLESKSGNQSYAYIGKRPSGTFDVGSIPTKRIRTATARQRFTFGALSEGLPSKTEVSSGDTNSYQDDQSSLHRGYQSRNNLDVESTMGFERPLQFDLSEVSTKVKKKKKPKHLGFKNSLNLAESSILFAQGKRLQVDPIFQHEQRDLSKKRLESQHYDSSGNAGIYGQYAAKKPKLLKQLPETSPEAMAPISGSIPSPVASQMSNMSNSNKLIKIVANRDRGKKNKTMKIDAGHAGSGCLWSQFEDQALVVLVHDLGPNWELVSDAINSNLQFKCICRKPKECKERHKTLMDKSSGDGADSAEDSGSSQPYPSTLPGIPKGSARQLFQCLQGPMEEETLKAHFHKIILLGRHLHPFKRHPKNDTQELKQITPPHSSHVVALSQVCPNNLSGGVLTPLDLCDAVASNADVLPLGFQGSHASGLQIPGHQGSATPMLPTSGGNPILNGSSGMVLGTSLPPITPLNAQARDGQRYGLSRQSSLLVDEQQRMQQYNHMLSGRNIQQSNMSVPGPLSVGVDRGLCVLPGSNGMGMMGAINCGMPMHRPSVQGIASTSMLNMVSSGSMLPASGVTMPNSVSVHPGAVGPANPMLRPRDPLQMLRSGPNLEEHRQIKMQDFPMQVSQVNGQGVPSFNNMTAPFPNATVSPSIQTFTAQQHQQSHPSHMLGNPHHSHIQGNTHSSPQQQGYAIRFAKDRQLQQRIIPQAPNTFTGQNIASQVQNASQVQPQSHPSSPVTQVSSSQNQQKQQISRNPQSGCGMPTQVGKQRQHPQGQQQQQQQAAKNQQQQQRQQSQQQAKLMKGIGRGGMLLHQNIPVDASHMNSPPANNKNQVSEKNLMQQSQGFYTSNPVLNSNMPQSSNQQKIFSCTLPHSSKVALAMQSHPDTSNQGSAQVTSNNLVPSSQQPPVSSLSSGSLQPEQRQTIQAEPGQKVILQQDHQINSVGRTSSSSEANVNQTIATATTPQCTDSMKAAHVVTSAQWKPEPSCETNTATNSSTLSQDNLVGPEYHVPPSKQGLVQRQLSGNLPLPGHSIGGQWQHQQNQQQQHRQAASGNLSVRPSNSGPG